ncbi:hypothetical protein Ndes2526B_g03241 [Nannochloris sp. 'desiccata']
MPEGESPPGTMKTNDYPPFVRLDQFGELGLKPQPLLQQLRLLFFAIFLVPFKAIGTLACLLGYFVVIKLSFLFPCSVRSDWVAALGKIFCRGCLFSLGFVRVKWIKIEADLKPPLVAAIPAVGIVSNHSSWIDILIHMSHSFPSFVARDATKRTPIIGSISQAMGCIYVDRSKRPSDSGQPGVSALVKQRMESMAAGRLPHARPMLLFPEGTTTNGQYMLHFRTGAFLAGAPLQPVIIRYNVGRFSPAWETITAPRHIFLLLCNPWHSVTCFELPVHVPTEEEREDPRVYAANVRRTMMSFSGLKDTSLTYEDKMQYVATLKKKYGLPVEVKSAAAIISGSKQK